MEPVTHVLTGACLARSGLNRRAAYATAAMAIAAELPDIDTVWGLRGPIEGFEHHRGITHTLIGIPFEAALLLLGFVLFHRFRSRRTVKVDVTRDTVNPDLRRPSRQPSATIQWGVLYWLILLALASHLLLDYTNNYGIRPFFPFQRSWYAGSFVFIFDPLLFLLLAAGLLLPSLFSLIGREIGAPREPFRGRGWARATLLGVLALWSVRCFEHNQAVAVAQTQTLRAPESDSAATFIGSPSISPAPQANGPAPESSPEDRPLLLPRRSLASPDPLSIFRWYTATDFGPAYRLGIVDSRLETFAAGDILVKAPPSSALEAAKKSFLGRVYLDWSQMPLLRVQDGAPQGAAALGESDGVSQTVTFTDLRFLGDGPFLRQRGTAPLTGQVILDASGQVVAEGMNGRFEN